MTENVKASEERISLAGTNLKDEMQSNLIMSRVLDNLNTLAYVISYETEELLFANKPLRDALGADFRPGMTCWQAIRPDLDSSCSFCKKDSLFDEEGNPRDINISFDIFNTHMKRWFLVTQTLIKWTDDSDAVLMTTIDITERKEMEKQLQFMASTDTATGTYNRGWGIEKLEAQCKQALTTGADITLAIFDIDYVKKTNDRFGHTAGDTLIKTIAETVQENLDEKDFLVRLGGDEFMIVFGDPSNAAAKKKMSTISSQISAINDKPRFPFVCSISYGLKTEKASEGNFVDNLITQTDALMYEAKRSRMRSHN